MDSPPPKPRTVSEVMTPAPAVLHASHSLRAAQRTFAQKGIQHLPVVQGGKLIGIITDRDVMRCLAKRPSALDQEVAFAMTRDPITVFPHTCIAEVVRLFLKHQIHCLPVVDSLSGNLVGVVTASDLLGLLGRENE